MIAQVAHARCIVMTHYQGNKKVPSPFWLFCEPKEISCDEAEYSLAPGVCFPTLVEKTILASRNNEARTPAQNG